MKIISWNVNGLRAVVKKDFYADMTSLNCDIICLQETKLQEDNLDDGLRNIEGYRSYFTHASKKGYSGVAIYTKFEPISVKHGFGIERFDSEGRILELEFNEFTLLNIYFPNGQRDDERLKYKMDFYDATLLYCNKLVDDGKKVLICGDFNTAHNEIDLKNAKANSNRSGFLEIERDWIDKFIDNGYIDTFRYLKGEEIKYSWWSYRFNARKNNAGWRIDYHFISNNMKENLIDCDILNDIHGSDHCPVYVELGFTEI